MWIKKVGTFGTACFALSMAFFGVQMLLVATGWSRPNPQSPWSVTDRSWSGLMAVVALGGTIGLVTSRPRIAAALLAALALGRALVYVPALTFTAQAENDWTNAFQLLAWCGTSLILVGTSAGASSASGRRKASWAALSRVGCLLYASSLPVFGIEHLEFGRDIATMVPSWIPWHLFWTYFAGVAFLAAAVSIATGVRAQLGATSLGLMLLLWVLLLWLPAIARDLGNPDTWTNAVITLAMSAGAFMIAGLVSAPPDAIALGTPALGSPGMRDA